MTPGRFQAQQRDDAARDLRDERATSEHLRELLNDAWLVINDPANSFRSAEILSAEIERELGEIKGCMRPARGAANPAPSGLADAFGTEAKRAE
jgi:hypothetical protein